MAESVSSSAGVLTLMSTLFFGPGHGSPLGTPYGCDVVVVVVVYVAAKATYIRLLFGKMGIFRP